MSTITAHIIHFTLSVHFFTNFSIITNVITRAIRVEKQSSWTERVIQYIKVENESAFSILLYSVFNNQYQKDKSKHALNELRNVELGYQSLKNTILLRYKSLE